MKVSVIMCAYNAEAFIDEAIQCILQQTYTNWELIISDDKSTDNTIAIIKKYVHDNRIKLFAHKENKGYVANKNRAFAEATGDLLTQLDADDTCPTDRLQKQVDVFINHPEMKICGGNYDIIDTLGSVIDCKSYEKDIIITELMLNYPFWFPGLMFRKKVVSEFGLFSEYFNGIYGDDHYWTMRVNKKYPIYFIKNVVYGYRINPNSITNIYDKPRKLIAQDIIAELYRQLTETNNDWLAEGKENEMLNFEKGLYTNGKLMSERYRMWAAKEIDKKNWKQAKALLKLSFATGNAGSMVYRTFFYYLRRRYLDFK